MYFLIRANEGDKNMHPSVWIALVASAIIGMLAGMFTLKALGQPTPL